MTTAELRRLLAEAHLEAIQAQAEWNSAALYEGPTEARWALWRAVAPILPALLDVVEAAEAHLRRVVGPAGDAALRAALAKLEEET